MTAPFQAARRRRLTRRSVTAIEALERRDCPAPAISAVMPPRPTVTISDAVVTEGNSRSTQAVFTVSLSAATTQTVSVPFATADGTATAGNDYVTKSGTLVFTPGQRSKLLVIDVIGDASLESDERFTITLGNPVNATLAKATGQATIRNDDIARPGFQIDLDFAPDVPQVVRNSMALAAKRWERVIVGDVPTHVGANGDVVDDVRVYLQMGLLGGSSDGPANVMANANPTESRANGIPSAAIVGIDPADAALNATSPTNFVIGLFVHELTHALGFCKGHASFDKFVSTAGFTGPSAVAEYRRLFRTTAMAVPIAIDGSHWNGAVFEVDRLHRVTVGAFQDLGYQVSFAAADQYVPSATAIAMANALANQQAAAMGSATPSGKRSVAAAFARLVS